MVLEDNTDITGPDDLAGKKVCSVEGSTPAKKIARSTPEADSLSCSTPTPSASSRCATARSTP